MQTRFNLTNLCSQVFVALHARLALLVIFGCILLLVALTITSQLPLIEHAWATHFATHQLVEGPPDTYTFR
jgi:hypothetical protein